MRSGAPAARATWGTKVASREGIGWGSVRESAPSAPSARHCHLYTACCTALAVRRGSCNSARRRAPAIQLASEGWRRKALRRMATEAAEGGMWAKCAAACSGESDSQVEECRRARVSANAAAAASTTAVAASVAFASVAAFVACEKLDGAAPGAPGIAVAPLWEKRGLVSRLPRCGLMIARSEAAAVETLEVGCFLGLAGWEKSVGRRSAGREIEIGMA